MAGVGPGEGGLGWSVDGAGPTVTAACPTSVLVSGNSRTPRILQRPEPHPQVG